MARPRKQVDAAEVVRLRREGMSWPKIAHRLHLGAGTVYRAYRATNNAVPPFQNRSKTLLRKVAGGHSGVQEAFKHKVAELKAELEKLAADRQQQVRLDLEHRRW